MGHLSNFGNHQHYCHVEGHHTEVTTTADSCPTNSGSISFTSCYLLDSFPTSLEVVDPDCIEVAILDCMEVDLDCKTVFYRSN